MDASIGIYMEKVDMVMVGAEGVCASGGILNKVGTYPLAICARAVNKPFYVVAESYKFIRLYPLKQSDVPSSSNQICTRSSQSQAELQQTPKTNKTTYKNQSSGIRSQNEITNKDQKNSTKQSGTSYESMDMLDYTPQAFITLILTDLGPLTTAAISDELMKVYL